MPAPPDHELCASLSACIRRNSSPIVCFGLRESPALVSTWADELLLRWLGVRHISVSDFKRLWRIVMKNQSGVVRLLGHTELFGGLSVKSETMLAEMAAIAKSITKGSVLFGKGDTAFSLYLLGSGGVELSKSSSKAAPSWSGSSDQGNIGEVALFGAGPLSGDCYGAARRHGVSVAPPRIQPPARRRLVPDEFIGLLMAKQRYLAQNQRSAGARGVEERFFLFLDQHFGRRAIQPGMSKKDLAAAIATVPATFSRLLLRLKKEKLAGVKGNPGGPMNSGAHLTATSPPPMNASTSPIQHYTIYPTYCFLYIFSSSSI